MKVLPLKIYSLLTATTIMFAPLFTSTAFASPTVQLKNTVASTTNTQFATNKLVVKYKEPLSYATISKLKGTVIQQLPTLKYTVLQFKNDADFRQAVTTLSTMATIENIALSPTYQSTGSTDVKETYQYLHSKLKTKQAYRESGKNKVKVAVIDTGIDDTNPDLKGKIVFQKNSVNPMKKSVKLAHGTHVAGIIAANYQNGIGGFGVYPNAQIYSYDVFNGSTSADDYTVASAIVAAANAGVKVMNLSLGSANPSTIIEDAINYAYKKNIVIVASAGNDTTDAPSYPASYDHVLDIGSTNVQNKLSSFSNFGPSVDLVAPGENIYSTSYAINRSSTFEFMSGTSMASPAVTGVVAMLLSKHKNLTVNQVAYILEHTAKDLGDKGRDLTYGAGLVQPVKALQYNTKKIPSLLTTTWTKSVILDKAPKLQLNKTSAGKLTRASEEHWRQIPVKKGQLIQATLVPNSMADMQLTIRFYSKTTSKSYTINNGAVGATEAKYVKAPFDGQLAIGVKDTYGNADDHYKLTVNSTASFPTDEATLDKPYAISAGASTINNLYMNPTTSGSDQDVFHFKATKNQLMQFKTSALPGVDLSLEVYKKEDLYGDGIDGPLVSINKNGISEGEHMSFTTEAGEDYYVIVSNSSNSLAVPDSDLLSSLSAGLIKPQASLLPYSLTASTKNIPTDEDSIVFDTTSMSKINQQQPETLYSLEKLFKSVGRSFDVLNGVKGYLQGSNDIDGYYFKTTKSGFYEFQNKVASSVDMPTLTLYSIVKDPETGLSSEEFLASNVSEDGVMKKVITTSLKAKTTYLVEVSVGTNGSIPFQGYTTTAKVIQENINDQYEINDEPEQAKTIQAGKKVTANFSMPNDVDFYYFHSNATGIYGINMTTSPLAMVGLNKQWTNYYTKNITIYRDYNNNHKMDTKDLQSGRPLALDTTGAPIDGSIEAKKGQNFFIQANPTAFQTTDLFSMFPYSITLKKAQQKDEDTGNKVKKNTPSKAIKFKNYTSNYTYSRKGYLNPGHRNGDVDWYSLQSNYTKKVTIALDVPSDLDGVVEVYKKGKLVKTLDTYGIGDVEIATMKLTKGVYYFKVRDRDGNASVNPYELSVDYN